ERARAPGRTGERSLGPVREFLPGRAPGVRAAGRGSGLGRALRRGRLGASREQGGGDGQQENGERRAQRVARHDLFRVARSAGVLGTPFSYSGLVVTSSPGGS